MTPPDPAGQAAPPARIAVILNVAAGTGHSPEARERLREVFARHGMQAEILAAGNGEEIEQRVAEAWHAHYSQDLWRALRFLPVDGSPPVRAESGAGTATAALLVGIAVLCVMVFTLGLFFPLGLPVGLTAWALGRDARRNGPQRALGIAVAGERMGIVVSLWAALMLAGCAALLGKRRLAGAAPPVPEQAVADVKADVEEIKERTHR